MSCPDLSPHASCRDSALRDIGVRGGFRSPRSGTPNASLQIGTWSYTSQVRGLACPPIRVSGKGNDDMSIPADIGDKDDGMMHRSSSAP